MNNNQQSHQSHKIDLLDEIQEGIFILTGEQEITINKLMTNTFIVENTDFDSLVDFFKAAEIKSKEDLQNKNFDDFIKSHTRFDNWDEMLVQSSNQYVSRHAGA
ncbi:MAG: hypothetical protein M3033_15170 [Acidobacteriota bacterium]|nr:hypothetical protein [Acidobacteriota bacterium]